MNVEKLKIIEVVFDEYKSLLRIKKFDQAIWLDFISRSMLDSGELKVMIAKKGLKRITSKTTIFKKAVDDSRDYDNAIRKLVIDGKHIEYIYKTLNREDVQHATYLFTTV
jgi:transaldolase